MFIQVPCMLTDDESCADELFMYGITDDAEELNQEMKITYDGVTHDLVPVLKDIIGTKYGELVDMDRLRPRYLRGVHVTYENLALLYSVEPLPKGGEDILEVGVPIEDVYNLLHVNRFKVGVYNYYPNDPEDADSCEMVEAFDLTFEEEDDDIYVEINYLDDNGEEENEEVFIPVYDYFSDEDCDCDDQPDDDDRA